MTTSKAASTGERGIIDADRRSAFTGRKWVRWSNRMKMDFLDHLASTCNVKASAEAIGVTQVSVYALRRRDAAFAAAWGEALASGYEMLETLVVGHVLSGGASERELAEGGAPDGETRQIEGLHGPINLDQAVRLLTYHRGAMQGKPTRGGPRPGRATREETNASILKKLIALDKRKGLA